MYNDQVQYLFYLSRDNLQRGQTGHELGAKIDASSFLYSGQITYVLRFRLRWG